MARITNLGRKRTYLEAGFENSDRGEEPQTELEPEPAPGAEGEAESLPKKKPRKRRRKAKGDVQSEEGGGKGNDRVDLAEQPAPNKTRKEAKRKRAVDKADASERRRLKRVSERDAHKTCLACRKLGHTAKDCPEARTVLHDDDAGTAGVPGKSAVGLCYRCGSKRHNLSRCKKSVNPANPLPFASCFVCSGKGHLASSCPKNQGKGIYPNGGCCKLCGQTSHLAKDCELRTQDNTTKGEVMLGSIPNPDEGGADEDDFHVLKRRRDAVQQEEKMLQKAAGKPAASVAKQKAKVVVFQ